MTDNAQARPSEITHGVADRFQVLREFHPTPSEPTAAWIVADMELKRAGRPFSEWSMGIYAPDEKVAADALARLLNRGAYRTSGAE